MRQFQIRHLALSIDDPLLLLGELTDKMLGMFPSLDEPTGESDAMRMSMTVHQIRHHPLHQEAVPQVWQGTVDGTHIVVSRRGTRRRIELPGRAVADFDIGHGWARLCLSDASDVTAKWFLLLRIVCDGLTRGGHCFAHAACLALPRGDQWQGVVISAPSNTGKTTTALALVDSGWRLLGDDITYVRPPHLGTAVWGFPRACHIRPGTLKLLPWLMSAGLGQPNSEGVRTLPLSSLSRRGWIDAPWLTPALVVVLAPPNPRATRVDPIDRVEALSHLSSESIDAIPGVCNEEAGQEFSTLGRLVCAAPSCRLSAGPDLHNIARLLEELLESKASSVPAARCMATQGAA